MEVTWAPVFIVRVMSWLTRRLPEKPSFSIYSYIYGYSCLADFTRVIDFPIYLTRRQFSTKLIFSSGVNSPVYKTFRSRDLNDYGLHLYLIGIFLFLRKMLHILLKKLLPGFRLYSIIFIKFQIKRIFCTLYKLQLSFHKKNLRNFIPLNLYGTFSSSLYILSTL